MPAGNVLGISVRSGDPQTVRRRGSRVNPENTTCSGWSPLVNATCGGFDVPRLGRSCPRSAADRPHGVAASPRFCPRGWGGCPQARQRRDMGRMFYSRCPAGSLGPSSASSAKFGPRPPHSRGTAICPDWRPAPPDSCVTGLRRRIGSKIGALGRHARLATLGSTGFTRRIVRAGCLSPVAWESVQKLRPATLPTGSRSHR